MRTVTVVGLGKIGLPLAVTFAAAGHRVTGADISGRVVADVMAGRPPFPGEPGLTGRLAEVRGMDLLRATTDTTAAVSTSEVVVIVVPLVVGADRRPDHRALDAAVDAVGAGLRPGSLVIVETTLPVHTTRRRITPRLAAASGLRPGRDFGVCHSPERVSSGRVFADLVRYPKLVGGIDPASGERAAEFYTSSLRFVDRPDLSRPNGVWDLGSAEAAELAKLAETTYRDVNIALANEFACFAHQAGLDLLPIVEAANSQPYSHLHRPGIAVGGHCIPVYPWLYAAGDPAARLPLLAREINDAMPARAIEMLTAMAGDLRGRRAAVLGLAYRGGVKETAFTGALPVVRALEERGAVPVVHDPLFDDHELSGMGLEPYHLGEPCDVAIVQADHPEYTRIGPDDLPGVTALLDGRSVTDPVLWSGVPRLAIGAGAAPPTLVAER
ncbi:nucleotide sugar dehydrogenase [Streptacidiphilus pinicola]|uniref:Nucleotide sugar dehydrogenase n=1 Tax=Streptacidiphilus pinicola TaxID=2219663 RepID=A0A2X0IM73_9ACTN|nr:nucleotide sugar dehydrogenase [Streptacidiphilus pinicola]RAG85767.1 nucleotide sugar dehydrogenase [Streptacidiphilus pinicola]